MYFIFVQDTVYSSFPVDLPIMNEKNNSGLQILLKVLLGETGIKVSYFKLLSLFWLTLRNINFATQHEIKPNTLFVRKIQRLKLLIVC